MNLKNPIVGTLCYFWRETGSIPEILLAWKEPTVSAVKLKIAEKFNGYGGKYETSDASLEETCIRETCQESGVLMKPSDLTKMAIIIYRREGVPDFICHFFVSRTKHIDPRPTREMTKPTWFKVSNLPYSRMMAGDPLVLPAIICNQKVKGIITYDQGMEVIPSKTHIETVISF